MKTPTTQSISVRLRTIRHGKGLSLREVQILSNGSIPAVVLGSYERGDRALSVNKAIQLAALYQMPLSYLLVEPESRSENPSRVVIDLRRLRLLIADRSFIIGDADQMRSVITFISGVAQIRHDWNGEVLSLRESDLTLIAMTLGAELDVLLQQLTINKLLIQLEG